MDYFSSVARRTRSGEAAFLRAEWERRHEGRSAGSRGAAAAAEAGAERGVEKRKRRKRGGRVSRGSGPASDESEVEEQEEVPLVRKRRRRGMRFSIDVGDGREQESDEVDNVGEEDAVVGNVREEDTVFDYGREEEIVVDDHGGEEEVVVDGGREEEIIVDDRGREEEIVVDDRGRGEGTVFSNGIEEENVEKDRTDSEDDVVSISSNESMESESESSESSGNDDLDLDEDYRASEGSTSAGSGGGDDGDDDDLDYDFSSDDSEQEYTPRMGYQAGRSVQKSNVIIDDTTGVQLKRKKISGLDVLVTPGTCHAIGSSSMAQRTRSHCVSAFSKKVRKKMGLGTFSSPICCDDEDIDSSGEDGSTPSLGYDSYGDDDGLELEAAEEERTMAMSAEKIVEASKKERTRTVREDGIEETAGKVTTSTMRKENANTKRKEKIIGAAENETRSRIRKEKIEAAKKTKTRVKRKKKIIALGKAKPQALKKDQIEVGGRENKEKREKKERRKKEKGKCSTRLKFPAPLYNLLFLEVDGVVQRETENKHDVSHLPLDFTFEVEEPIQEKTDYEKQLEPLWAEFDFALRSAELGSFNSSAIDNENARKSNVEGVPTTLCQQGKHDLILDEEIGIKCTLCSFVKLEIKHVCPSMDAYSSERISRRYCSDAANISWDGFHFQDGVSQGLPPELKGTIWERFPNIRQKMYKHQQEGFEFLWRNLAGSINLEELKKPNTSEGVGGCVISHAPGTGKTFLTIAFLQTFMSVFEDCRPVIMAPCSMLLTWEEEFRKWNVNIPFHNLNAPEFSGKEDERMLELVGGRNSCSIESVRIVKLMSWRKGKSVLGVSYSLFEKHAGQKFVEDREGRKREVPRDKIGEDIRKTLLEKPSLLVLDEGHTPRNDRSCIWKALQNIKTERRIILSGTPFQNNFDELYNTLWLVRPKFANRISSTKKVCQTPSNLLSEKEAKGKWASLTNSIGKGSDSMLQEIRSMIEPFVHVHKGAILQNLPGLRDCVIRLHLTELQKQILEETREIRCQFNSEHRLSLVTIHPSLLLHCKHIPARVQNSFFDKITLKTFKLDPSNGVKTRFLMELIKLSDTLNEKVLVFSQYINPFSLIKDQLRQHFNWSEGVEVEQMDGKLNVKHRQSLIKSFNDPYSKVRVLLASIKACREGINLIGASRVVLLDVVWNPSVVRQAISRAYRIGQKKIVHTYHLITSGTEEHKKYWRQVQKNRLSKLVFSSSHGHVNERNSSSVISDDKILEEMVANGNLKDMFDKIKIITKTVDID